MKKYFVFLLCGLVMFGLGYESCSKDDPDPIVIDDPVEPPEPPEPPDPELPVLAGSISIGAVNYTVDSTYTEKIEDGFWYLYVQLKNENKPLIIHSLRYTTGTSGYSIETWIGNDSITGKETPEAMVNRYEQAGRQVRMAINGGFFGTEAGGTPMSTEVMNGVMAFPPSTDEPQPIIGFDEQNRPYMGYVQMNATVTTADSRVLNISSVNGSRWADHLVLYNSYMGKYTKTNEWGTEVLCTPVMAQWERLSSHINVRCRVERVESMNAKGNMEIQQGKIVLSGHGVAHEYLSTLQQGDYVYVTADYFLESDPNITSTILRNVVSGYNIVLQENNIVEPDPALIPDMPLVTNSHPRTSVGFSADKSHVFFTVVEGRREGLAAGVTTKELAQVMKYLGAANAINLDGGGSSCLMIDKRTKNYCTDGTQRAVTDGFAIIRK